MVTSVLHPSAQGLLVAANQWRIFHLLVLALDAQSYSLGKKTARPCESVARVDPKCNNACHVEMDAGGHA